jgi:hypothetical protein
MVKFFTKLQTVGAEFNWAKKPDILALCRGSSDERDAGGEPLLPL